jgi:phosphatidylglycerophosphatase A
VVNRTLWYWIASLGGIGRCPVAPGTAATLAAGLFALLVLSLFSQAVLIVAAEAAIVLGCIASDAAERELGVRDPGEIVIDELAGYLVALIGHPVVVKTAVLAFLFFRLYDIWKPWPLRLLQDRLEGGLAVMADDVGAGVYANLSVWLLMSIWR